MKFTKIRGVGLIGMVCLSGCTIQKFNQPPQWASAVITHERFFGLNANIPSGGGSIFRVQLGWGSHTWTVIPVSTNRVYVAPVSDTFSLGQDLNPFNTSIKEDVQTGWEGSAPLPRLKFFKDPLP